MFQKMNLCVLGLLTASNANADWTLILPDTVTTFSAGTYDLHAKIMYGFCAIAALVFTAMIYALVRHRKSPHAGPAAFSNSVTAEMIWTAIPIVILLVMVRPSAEAVLKGGAIRNQELASATIELQCPRQATASATTQVSVTAPVKESPGTTLC